MSTKVIIAAPHQDSAAELAGLLAELDDATVVDIADTSARLERLVGTHQPEVAFVHEELGPVGAMDTVRTLIARYPGTAVLVVADNPSSDLFAAAMDAGARGVLARPLVLDELVQRFEAAAQWSATMRSLLAQDTTKVGGAM
ncbi:response regulator, partial [uncultured Aeromicrobium sp.]|uniref:response regulator n=1 Tax=uncultured Aeromicrobium sp. TaxID=337820 RepID=UPI0025EC2865